MPAFQPTADQFRAFRDDPYDGPIAQINLLKYRVQADDAEGTSEYGADEPGATAYRRYVRRVPPGGGRGGRHLCARRRRRALLHRQWRLGRRADHAVPQPGGFIATINHPSYAAMSRHRDAGLLCQELITTRPS